MIKILAASLLAGAAIAAPAFAADNVVIYTPGETYYYAPYATYYYYEPERIVVTSPRDLNTDAAITDDVAYTLASDPRLSGNIGVDSYRGNVTLTGRVTRYAQIDLAGQRARSIDGVKDVSNYLRARVGG